MKKRILSMLLAFVMLLGMLPGAALATEETESEKVYISISYNGRYTEDKNGVPVAYVPVELDALAAIDLNDYGLSEYLYDEDGDGEYEITALHLYIYVHETILGSDWNNVGVSGSAGSIFFEYGLFDFVDCNLQYYYNGEYPAVDGWGITADQLVLSDGDFLDIAGYTSWSFYSDPNAGFHFFLDGQGTELTNITHEYTVTAGENLTVTLARTAQDAMSGGATMMVPEDTSNYYDADFNPLPIYYSTTLYADDAASAEIDSNGQANITFDEAGTYYLWADGGYGEDGDYDGYPDVVSSPAYAVVTVTAPACEHSWTDATCTTPKTCALCGTTEGEADPDAHSYVDGICEHCGAAEPVATPSYTIKLSEAEELTAGLNYFISVPAEALGKDIIFDFGSGTISGMMCQRHCSQRNIHTAGEGSTLILSAETVAAHLCDEAKRAEVAEDFDLYLTEGSQMFAFYWWTTANLNGSYIYIEILPAEEPCAHETWNAATCTTPKTCALCGATEGEADPDAHSYVDGVCEHCGAAKPVYTIKLSEAEELTAGLNYFISVPAEGMDIIFDFGSGTISGMMCQRHCSQRNIHTAGEGSTLILSAETVAAHLCSEAQRAEVAEDFDLYLTEDSQMFAFYWWTTANTNGSYIYIEILPAEDVGGGDEDATYTVTLPTNNVGFSVRATSSPTVTAGGEFSFKLNIYDDYKKGENFKVKANGVDLTSSSDTYTITNITENVTVTVEGVVEKTLAEKNVTVIVPAGSTVTTGLFHSYFKYDFVDVLEVTILDDGRLQYIVPAASGGDAFIRVQHPEGVTYWDFGDLTIGKVFDITEEMLFIGSTEYTKDTVYANYEKNAHDTASLYLTVNAQGWLDMDSGDTHSLNVFRNWIPVSNSTSNTGVSLPDVTYTVVDINGNPSDVVIVTPDANNSCYADITAVKAGTAIILVTYDAVYNADGEGGKQFSAIWPENTGVIVVTVGAEDADIQTNIIVNEEANAGGKQILDTEHDILFYVGNAGAQYSFKPEDGCTVTVARSAVGDEMSFNGFTAEGVTVAEDGTVTISGLTTGAHIVKVEKDGKTAYQVIRAREVSYKLTHSDGSEVTAENPAQPGEIITVQFSRLIDPMGKLSGVYNAKFGFRYVDEADTVISINSSSAYGEYYFGSNPVRQRFTVTVPTEWDKETYTLTDGSIMLGGWGGSFGDHRSTTYMEGKEPNLNASGTGGYASVLPNVVIPVYVDAATLDQRAAAAVEELISAIGEVTLDSETAIVEARAAYDALTDAQKTLVENYAVLTAAEETLAELKAESMNGLHEDADGIWRYYVDGVVTDYTGLVEHTDGKTYYVYKGIVPMDYIGLYNHTDGKIYYIYYGVAQKTYVGLYAHSNGVVYYIDNGTVSTTYTGLYAHSDGKSYYVYNGVIPTDYIGLCYHTDGKTYYIYKGVAVSSYTGLYDHTDGKVYYVNEGVIDPNFVGLFTHTTGTTYYVYNGVVLTSYVGLYLHTDGYVYYVYNGVLIPSYVGFYLHTDGKLYYMSEGVIAVDFTGLALHTNGKLYYVVNGVFDPTYNGTAKTVDGTEYEVVNGIAQP